MPQNVRIDRAAMGRLLREDPRVARQMLKAGDKLKRRTLDLMQPSEKVEGEFFPKAYFKTRIHTRIKVEKDGPHAFVGAAETVTKPHIIRGRNSPRQVLAFTWPKRGSGTFYFKQVNHPGSDLTKYVNKKLLEALATLRGTL